MTACLLDVRFYSFIFSLDDERYGLPGSGGSGSGCGSLNGSQSSSSYTTSLTGGMCQ